MKNKRLLNIFLVVFIDLLGFGLILPLLPYYAGAYGASSFVVGLLTAAYALAQFVGAPFLGRLSDRYGRRPVLMISIAGTALELPAPRPGRPPGPLAGEPAPGRRHRGTARRAHERDGHRRDVHLAHHRRAGGRQHHRRGGVHRRHHRRAEPRQGAGPDRCGVRPWLHFRPRDRRPAQPVRLRSACLRRGQGWRCSTCSGSS